MQTEMELMEYRTKFSELLDLINPKQKEIELSIYDLLLDSRIKYMKSLENRLDELFQMTISYSQSGQKDDLKEYEIKSNHIKLLTEYGHGPAYLIALNFKPGSYHDNHKFRGEKSALCVGKNITSKDPNILENIKTLGYSDGAMLIENDGTIFLVKAQLVNLDAKAIYENQENLDHDSYKTYGFKEKVNTRHYSALGASYHLEGLITYTLSEETGNIRRFEKGKITASTMANEV